MISFIFQNTKEKKPYNFTWSNPFAFNISCPIFKFNFYYIKLGSVLVISTYISYKLIINIEMLQNYHNLCVMKNNAMTYMAQV